MARITKEVNSVNIEFAENGFVMDYSGRDEDGEYTNTKQIFNDIKGLFAHLDYIATELSEYK